MGIAKVLSVILVCLIPMMVLGSNKHHKKSAAQLHSRAKNELIGGTTTGVFSVGAAATGGLLLASVKGSGYGGIIIAMAGVAGFLPLAIITGSIAIIFIVKGVKHRRKAKRLAKLEEEHKTAAIS